MKKHIVLLSIILLSFQIDALQKQSCEGAFRSFKESVVVPIRSRIQRIMGNLKSLYLLVTLTQENEANEVSPLMSLPNEPEVLRVSGKKNLAELKKALTSAGYNLAKPLDLNDTETIKKKLNREKGDGVAAINIEFFDSGIAEKIREAILQLSENKPGTSSDPSIKVRQREKWESWREQWPYNELISTGKVSSREIQQFEIEIDQLIQTTKDLIFKIDGENIEADTLHFRTEATKHKFLSDNHTHKYPYEWVSVNVSALGLGSWMAKTENGKQQKLVTLPGQVWLMSEMGRNMEFSTLTEEQLRISSFRKDSLHSVTHGTPHLQTERLLIIITFRLASKEDQSL